MSTSLASCSVGGCLLMLVALSAVAPTSSKWTASTSCTTTSSCAVVVASSSGITPQRSFVPPPSSSVSTSFRPPNDTASEVLRLVNNIRHKGYDCGSKGYFKSAMPLLLEARLVAAANLHALDQARHEHMSHTGSDHSQPSDRVSAQGFPWRTVGENVAMGQVSAAEVVQAWLRSPGHCANLLNEDFTHMGIAQATSSQGVPYWAQTFASMRLIHLTNTVFVCS